MKEQIILVEKYYDKLIGLAIEYGPNVIGAIIVLIVGFWLTKLLTKWINKALKAAKIDPTLIPFLKNLINILLKLLIVISAMGMVGIQMTSFIAMLGAVGLAIGMALSGTLQNFAGGVVILILKPFKANDFIEAQGYIGIVNSINMFTTKLTTLDNKLIIIPNGPLSSGSLTNYSADEKIRLELSYGLSYGDDMDMFKKAIDDFIDEDDRILRNPAPFVGIEELGDSSVKYAVWIWINVADYWDVFFSMNEKVYKRVRDYGLKIPFPQMDVHIKK